MGVTVKINSIQPAFNNAHRLLWDKYNPEGKVLEWNEVDPFCKDWWFREHQVKIYNYISVTSGWEYAEFPKAEDITHFMLKYS